MVRIVQKFGVFLFVVAIFVGMPAYADTTAIQSVIAYGKTEQNGTPTPTNPVPIMTNNGELKYSTSSKNLANPAYIDDNGWYIVNDVIANNKNANRTIVFPCKPNTTYSWWHTNGAGGMRAFESDTNNIVSDTPKSWAVGNPSYVQANVVISYTTSANAKYLVIDYGRKDNNSTRSFEDQFADFMLVEGLVTTATAYEPYREGDIYADGLTETIRDSAGHSATAQMLLGLNDTYRDEQNINTGAITRKVGVKVLDGSENWDLYNWSAGNVRDVMRVTLSSIAPDAKKDGVSLCSHFVRDNVGNFNGNTSAYAWASTYFDGTPRVVFRVAGITTVKRFKQWLAEQYAAGTPVIVLYPLAEPTTESVTAQSLTTAPVRQTLGAIMNMPIVTTLMDGTVVGDLIRVATTKYNEESFSDVQGALSGVFNAVDTVVTQTMDQAQAIDQIANEKQTRPDENCPVGKNCLLVEDENGNPNWYVIAGADEANPTTNP